MSADPPPPDPSCRSPEPEPEPEPEHRSRPAPVGDVDIDDVIVAWAEILPALPPATRAAVREAQPLAVADDVITFGVPEGALRDRAAALQEGSRQHPRRALASKLGRRMMFKPVAHDGFDADPVEGPAHRHDEEPPDDDDASISRIWSTRRAAPRQ